MAPVQSSPDNYGVDLATGALNLSITDISVGNESSGLTHTRHWVGLNQWRDQFDLTLYEANGKVVVGIGGGSKTFTKTGSTYVSDQGDGASLVLQNAAYVYTAKDGSVTTFARPAYRDGYRATQVRRPDGETLTFSYASGAFWIPPSTPWSGGLPVVLTRLSAVDSSSGYRLNYLYVSDAVNTVGTAGDWLARTGVSVQNVQRGTGVLGTSTYSQPAYYGARTLSVSDMAGRSTAYGIDASGRITSITYPGSGAADISIVYNSMGRIAFVTDASGTTSYVYNDNGNVRTTSVTDSNGATSSYTFNIATQKMLSSTNAAGQTTTFQYDGYGRTTRVTAPEGNATQYTYDTHGNVTETRVIAKPGSGIADAVSSALYPCTSAATCDKPQWTRDARANQTDYSYDQATGNVLSVVAPPDATGLRATTTFGYTMVNGVQRVNRSATCRTAASCPGSASERVTTLSYDVNGLPATVTDQAGDGSVASTVSTTYDVVGNAVSVDGPLPGADDTSYFRYDAARQRIGQISPDPDGAGPLARRAVRTTYDARGRATLVEQGTVTDASDGGWNGFSSLQQVARGFDGLDRQTSETTSAGGTVYSVVQKSYVGQRLECSAVRLNNAVWGTLPASACTAQAEGPSGPDRITRYGYDAAGRVTQVTAGYGTSTTATEATSYTPNGRTASVTDANGNVTTYAYDGMDRLGTTTYPGGSTERLVYDENGKITQRWLRDGQVIGYGYDALGRLVSRDRPNTAYWEADHGYAYDSLGSLTRAWDSNGRVLTFGYDAVGRRTSQGDNWYGWGNAWYQYDAAGRRTRLTWGDGNAVGYDYLVTGEMATIRDGAGNALVTFGYDNLGRRTSLGRANGTVTSYAYDPASRLAQLTHDLAGTASDLTLTFGYNTAGQISSRASSNNAYTWVAPTNVDRLYSVNALNQYTQAGGVGFAYDARGNLTTSGGSGYAYTADNQLAVGPGGIGLAYDPVGRLFNIASDDGINTTLTYDGADVIAETNQYSGAVLRRYVYGPGSDEPLIWYEGAGLGDRRWLHADERGSIVAVTNDAGQAIAINRYDEFGIPQAGNIGRFQYTGQKWLPSVGLYHYKARVYSPTLGRFMQTDPIGYEDGLNWYAYAGNDPVNFTDPTGLVRIIPIENCPTGGSQQNDGVGDIVNTKPRCTVKWIEIPDGTSYGGGGPGGGGGGGAPTDKTPQNNINGSVLQQRGKKMSGKEREEAAEADEKICRIVNTRECWASAAERDAARVSGRPVPPLQTGVRGNWSGRNIITGVGGVAVVGGVICLLAEPCGAIVGGALTIGGGSVLLTN